MGLKERVYRGEATPPPDRVFEVEEWITVYAFITPVGARDGVSSGDTGWIPIESSELDADEVDRDFLFVRLTDVTETKSSAEVRDPAIYDLLETRPVGFRLRVRWFLDRVLPWRESEG